MLPSGSSTAVAQLVARTTVFDLAASRLTDPQVSYDDRYLAFQNNTTLQFYDFSREKVVWQTVPRRYGKILAYRWLPDREALLLFESGVGVDPNRPGRVGVGIYSVEIGVSQSGGMSLSQGSSGQSQGSSGSSGSFGVSTAYSGVT